MTRKLVVQTFTGLLLDERLELTLDEVCRMSGVQTTVVIGMVEEGLLNPMGAGPDEWLFPVSTLGRLRRARRLQLDLGLNLPGVALAMDLLDELRELRCRVANLEALLTSESRDKR